MQGIVPKIELNFRAVARLPKSETPRDPPARQAAAWLVREEDDRAGMRARDGV